MKHLITFLLLFCFSTALGFEGPDFMILGRDCLDEITPVDSLISNNNAAPIECEFANASLYDIKKLDWYYGQVAFNTRLGKYGFSFVDYGIKNLYETQKYNISFCRPIWSTLSIGGGFYRDMLIFGGGDKREHNDFLSIKTSYTYKTAGLLISAGEIPIKRGEKRSAKHIELLCAANWRAGDLILLHGIYYKDDQNFSRFDFGQRLNLARSFAVDAGLLTGPQVYYLGTVISYKRFAFKYVFYDVTQLPSCWSLALIVR
jgi:hypothetical protein